MKGLARRGSKCFCANLGPPRAIKDSRRSKWSQNSSGSSDIVSNGFIRYSSGLESSRNGLPGLSIA